MELIIPFITSKLPPFKLFDRRISSALNIQRNQPYIILENRIQLIDETMVTEIYLPSECGFCVGSEKRKLEVKNLFWVAKLLCDFTCSAQLTLGCFLLHSSPAIKPFPLHYKATKISNIFPPFLTINFKTHTKTSNYLIIYKLLFLHELTYSSKTYHHNANIQNNREIPNFKTLSAKSLNNNTYLFAPPQIRRNLSFLQLLLV